MPTSSGANGWPKSYFKGPPSPRSRQASPLPSKRLPSPEVVRTEEHIYDGTNGGLQSSNIHSSTTKTTRFQDGLSNGGSSKRFSKTVTSNSRSIDSKGGSDGYSHGGESYGRNGRMTTDQHGNIVNYSSHNSTTTGGYWRTGQDGKRVWISSSNSTAQYDSSGRMVQSSYHNSRSSGSSGGCCNRGGGDYAMAGSGRKRCCACLLGLLLALALLGLILGMLLGVKASNDKKSRESYIRNTLTGGYFVNGVYYYPVSNAPDVFYFAMGHLIPCNKFNNNSDQAGPTQSFQAVTDDATATAEVTLLITDLPIVTYPNCEDITTEYILAQNYSPSVTLSPLPIIPNEAIATAPNYGSFLALVVAFWVVRGRNN